jgi:ribosomal protein S21
MGRRSSPAFVSIVPCTSASRQPYKTQTMGVRIVLADKEPIGEALRRFKKMLERNGLTYDLRRHEAFHKPTNKGASFEGVQETVQGSQSDAIGTDSRHATSRICV